MMMMIIIIIIFLTTKYLVLEAPTEMLVLVFMSTLMSSSVSFSSVVFIRVHNFTFLTLLQFMLASI
jgi:hypothetical protein